MSAPLSQIDPMTQVYRQLWHYLEAEPGFAQQVPAGNRIKYDGRDRSPEKDRMSSADWPDFRIKTTGGPARLNATSDSTEMSKQFTFVIATGDKRLTHSLFPIEWSVLRAMAKAKRDNLGLGFVMDMSIESVNDTDSDPEGRPLNQWAGVLTVEVTMNFDTTELL